MPNEQSSTLHEIPRQSTEYEAAKWYLVYCQPLKEHYAAAALREQYELPLYLPEVKRYFKGHIQYAPLFPRYLFVRINLPQHPPSQINNTPGVSRLIMFNETPQPVPGTVVQAIQQQVERLNQAGGLTEAGLQPGDTVAITDGPLHGLEAIFVGPTTPSQRVRILLEFMGRLSEVEIDRRLLTPTVQGAATPAPKRARRTRGKGRVIKG